MIGVMIACTNAWDMACDTEADLKTLKSRSSALLYAHRCYLRDIPIKVPSPINTIPDMVIPSHIVVPRCSGKMEANSLQF